MTTYWRARVDSPPVPIGVVFCAVDPAGARKIFKEDGTVLGLNMIPHDPLPQAFSDVLQQFYGRTIQATIEQTELGPGEHYHRVWRGPHGPPPGDVCEREWTDAVAAARVLFDKMREVFRFIEPDTQNDTAFGHEVRQLLVLACMECESAWKAILSRGASTADYVKLVGPLRLEEWELSLPLYPRFPPFRPFQGWHDPQKRPPVPPPPAPQGPSQTLPWYNAYNNVKHDRGRNFGDANLGNMIHAMGGLFVMLCAQFGSWWGSGGLPMINTPKFNQRIVFGVQTQDFVIQSEPQWSPAQEYVPREIAGPTAPWSRQILAPQ